MADRQHAVLKNADLRACGVSSTTAGEWRAQGRLRRRYPGVSILSRGPLSWETELTAALFYVGPGSGLASLSGLHHFGILEARPRQLWIVAPGKRAPQPGLRLVQMRDLVLERHEGFPVVPVATALRQAARWLGYGDLRRALSEAEYLRLLVPADIESELGRGKPGAARLRRALSEHTPKLARTHGELERRFWHLCDDAGIPPYEPNHPIDRMHVDAAWPDRMHCTELDSRLAHGTSSRMERDLNRELVLRRLGWTVSRYSWEQVTERPGEVIGDLRAELALAS